jgi:hypothetical protein
MVIVDIPVVAVLEAFRVSVLLVPVTDVGLKLTVTPEGKPLATSDTVPVNPPLRVTVMVLLSVAPRFMLRLEGLADKEKSGEEA